MEARELIAIGRQVLADEARAVEELIPTVGESFAQAVQLILSCRGKVILTGVGKSGHIATKLASTLASTGTSAFFIQSAEAAHGDLGMIGPEDVVIAISNSGAGSELKVMIPVLKRRGIPLIAITGDPHSPLGEAAAICLEAHVSREACPLNLAPTSSSTAELALGDALAVALLEARGFTEQDFALSHPGGKLGRKLLLRCADLMHEGPALPQVQATTTIKEALFEMTHKGLGMVAVTRPEDGTLDGLFTDGDVRRAFERGFGLETPVAEAMTRSCITVSPATLAYDALTLMQKRRINGLIVVDAGKHPVGAFNMHDLLQYGIM